MHKKSEGTPVQITGMLGTVFEAVRDYIYTVDQPSFEGKDFTHAQSVLGAADRFGLTHMKLLAESEMVSHILRKDNAAAFILFADAHSCALLKEAAFDVYKNDPMSVRKSDSWNMLKESPKLLDELLEYTSCDRQSTDESGKEIIATLRVAELRDRIEQITPDEKDWPEAVDGTRECLIRKVKEHMEKEEKKNETDDGNDEEEEE
ncbi:MAG: hypothetical protein SGARI_007129 [Bacillariaceae sp.]